MDDTNDDPTEFDLALEEDSADQQMHGADPFGVAPDLPHFDEGNPTQREGPRSATTPAATETSSITGMNRAAHLRRKATLLRRHGASRDGLCERLGWINHRRCSPPLTADEVENMAMEVMATVEPEEARRILSAAQLLGSEIPARRFLVQHYMPGSGGVAVLYGSPGTGKSLLAQQWSLALAAGDSVALGAALPGVAKAVLMVLGEHHPASVKERLQRQTAARPVAGRLLIHDARDKAIFDESGGTCALEQMIDAVEPDLVVLDSATSLVVGDLSETQTAKRFMRLLHRLSKCYRVTFLVVAHPRKKGAEGDRGTAMDRLKGAQELAALSDVMVLLKRNRTSGYTVLEHVKARDTEKAEDVVLRLETTTLRFQVVVEAATGRQTVTADAIAQFILSRAETTTSDDLQNHFGVKWDTIRRRTSRGTFPDRLHLGEIEVVSVNRAGNATSWKRGTPQSDTAHAGGASA